MSRLTAKQEKYVQGLVAGLSQREAYRKAYPNSRKWKDRTVDSRASELFNTSNILGRHSELIEQHKDKALWTREESVKTLTWLIDKSIKSIEEQDEGYVRQGTSSAVLGALQELAKLEALYPMDETRMKKIEAETKLVERKAEEDKEQSTSIIIVDEWTDKDE